MPLFTCSCVLIAAGSAPPRRKPDTGPKPKPKPKRTRTRTRARVAPLADEFFDSYLRRREACEDLRTAYEGWGSCEPSQRIFRFEAYRAALEREERAARLHSHLAERLHAASG